MEYKNNNSIDLSKARHTQKPLTDITKTCCMNKKFMMMMDRKIEKKDEIFFSGQYESKIIHEICFYFISSSYNTMNVCVRCILLFNTYNSPIITIITSLFTHSKFPVNELKAIKNFFLLQNKKTYNIKPNRLKQLLTFNSWARVKRNYIEIRIGKIYGE